MEFVYLFTGIVFGVVAAFFYFSLINQKRRASLLRDFQEKEKRYEQQKVEAEKLGLVWEERFQSLKSETESWKSDLEKIREENTHLVGRLEKAKVEYLNIQEKLQTQKAELEEIQKKFTTEFENIANKILEKKQ
jgi:DNA recombination protein RmuC